MQGDILPQVIFLCFFAADYKTSNYLETNLAALDNSATPNLKHSQMHALEHNTDSMDVPLRDDVHLDWLGCIARKTGMPRFPLSFVIFCSAMVMIWLCFTTAVTAPEHRVSSQVRSKVTFQGIIVFVSCLPKFNPKCWGLYTLTSLHIRLYVLDHLYLRLVYAPMFRIL